MKWGKKINLKKLGGFVAPDSSVHGTSTALCQILINLPAVSLVLVLRV